MSHYGIVRKAFTLIEVLVVVAIIGIIAGLSVFGINDARANARDSVRKSNMELVSSALELYRLDCNKYPDALPSPGQPLTGKNPSGRCRQSNVYIASMPTDPQGPVRYYNYYSPPNNKTYELCASLEKSTGNTVSCGGSSVCGSQISDRQSFGSTVLAQELPTSNPACSPTPTPNPCSGQSNGASCTVYTGGCGPCWVSPPSCTRPIYMGNGTCENQECIVPTSPTPTPFCYGLSDGTPCNVYQCTSWGTNPTYTECSWLEGSCQQQSCFAFRTPTPPPGTPTPTPIPYTCNYKVSSQ